MFFCWWRDELERVVMVVRNTQGQEGKGRYSARDLVMKVQRGRLVQAPDDAPDATIQLQLGFRG